MHILGLTIVYWIIFRLLIIQRLPYHLDKTVTIIQVLIIISVILGSMLECKFILEKLLDKNLQSFIKNIIIKIVTNLYVKPLKQLQALLLTLQVLTNKLDPIKRILIMFTDYYLIAMVIYIFLMPRLYLTIALSLDVFLLKKICLFYKFLYVLIVPLIMSSLLSLIQEHSTTTLNNLEKEVVNISLKDNVYTIDIKDIALTYHEAVLVLESCMFNLEALTIISNIEDIRNRKYYLLLQLMIAIIFGVCWVWACFYILDSKGLI